MKLSIQYIKFQIVSEFLTLNTHNDEEFLLFNGGRWNLVHLLSS